MIRTLLGIAALSFLLAGTLPAAEPAKTPIILDCAIGNEMDDALALALASALPEVDLRAVTTVRKDAEVRAWMACRFLHAVDRRTVPVAFGRGEQPAGDVGPRFQYRYHPALIYNRMGKPAKETAVELMARELDGKFKEVTIVCTGPLTNVAQLLRENPVAARGIKQLVISAGSRQLEGNNLLLDLPAARAVLESSVPRLIVPIRDTTGVPLAESGWQKLFDACTLRTLQLQALWQLSDEPAARLTDVLAVSLAAEVPEARKLMTIEKRSVVLTNRGELQLGDSLDNPVAIASVVTKTQPAALVEWLTAQLTRDKQALPRENKNFAQLVARGNFPARVHAFEDFNSDIERRWWMAGKEETKIVPERGLRACRAVLTQDFDDRQGDLTTMYNSVTFNPVPGPPMGKNTRLSFRYWLKGTSELRIQLYSLTNGYHRYLTLKDLPQEKWQEGCVDMTQMRRPDGMGGPLAENERIDDVQFYVDPRAELIIDEFVLFDAAAEGEKRPFPQQIHFTGWFDTGKQGAEWPGNFEIVPDAGVFWKAAKSVPAAAENGAPWIRLQLRGPRPLGVATKLDFAAKLTGAVITVELVDTKSGRKVQRIVGADRLQPGAWSKATVTFMEPPRNDPGVPRKELEQADELRFYVSQGGTLLLDDVLLYGP